MIVDGECHCGRIVFSAEVDPSRLTLCHCTDCQAMSGSAFRANIGCAAETFRLLRGEPRLYIKTADSGAKRAMAFCPKCGSQIYSCAIERPAPYSLRSGTLRQRAELRPARQIWMRSAMPWAQSFDIQSFDGEPSPR